MDYWLKQTKESPLYPDLEWEKPERKDQAGKLLIIGGNMHGFAAPAKAYEYAQEAGIGVTRILLPDALRSTLHAYWTDAVFCPSTPSGSFARDSKEYLLNNSLWADGILLAGDLGRNSETAIVLDGLLESIKTPIALTKDALDYYLQRPKLLLDREHTLLVASFSQLQKLLTHYGRPPALTYTMPITQLVTALHQVTQGKNIGIVTKLDDIYLCSYSGTVSTTHTDSGKEIWRLETATRALVGLIHHENKPFEATCSSIIHIL